MKKYVAELFGTFTLVLVGTGIAVITGNVLLVALGFGLVVIAMAFSIGDISGAHLNPAVSLGFALNKRLSWKDFGFYVLFQVIGAFLASALLGLITGSFDSLAGNAVQSGIANSSLILGLVVEIVITTIFVFVILSVTSKAENGMVAGFVIALTLAVMIIFSFGLSSAGLNPARSLAPAILEGGTALQQVWLFIVGPFVGALIANHLFTLAHKTKAE